MVPLACSDDDGPGAGDGGGGPPTTAARVPATLPGDVEAGAGRLVLDGQAYALRVRSCQLQPVTDPDTGVTTELAVDADDELGVAVSITRSSTEGDRRTVTDTISVADPGGGLVEAQRVDAGGRYIDLLVEGPLEPLLAVDGAVVTGDGVFGPPGAAAGDPALLEGAVIVRC